MANDKLLHHQPLAYLCRSISSNQGLPDCRSPRSCVIAGCVGPPPSRISAELSTRQLCPVLLPRRSRRTSPTAVPSSISLFIRSCSLRAARLPSRKGQLARLSRSVSRDHQRCICRTIVGDYFAAVSRCGCTVHRYRCLHLTHDLACCWISRLSRRNRNDESGRRVANKACRREHCA